MPSYGWGEDLLPSVFHLCHCPTVMLRPRIRNRTLRKLANNNIILQSIVRSCVFRKISIRERVFMEIRALPLSRPLNRYWLVLASQSEGKNELGTGRCPTSSVHIQQL